MMLGTGRAAGRPRLRPGDRWEVREITLTLVMG
jgi:hypothetical protein